MASKRFIVEIGYGTDLHGGNVTKAAQRAVKDAISRNSLCGLMEILGMEDPDQMLVSVKIGCPHPEQVDGEEVLKVLPFGTREIEVVQGGLAVRGLDIPSLGEGDQICVAVAAVTVSVDAALCRQWGEGKHAATP